MTPTILVVDNYDSFAYNLVQYVGEHAAVVVRRNDAIDRAGLRDLAPDGVVVSPGPGHPSDAGISTTVFAETDIPALGVCLGHQALCHAHGVSVEAAPAVVHGKASTITHDGRGLFTDLPGPIDVGRYHSLMAADDLPDALEATAWTVAEEEEGGDESDGERDSADDGDVLMAVRHREKNHAGVQFHPESILTDAGKQLIRTFCEEWAR
jgi:anthranilate synthase component 2